MNRKDHLAHLEEALGEVYATIELLQSQLAQLGAKIEEQKARAERLRKEIADLAPVYTLSDAIAARILKFAYKHYFPHCRLDDGLPHTHSPIAISQVSRWWCKRALSLPSIWTCIHVLNLRTSMH